MKHIANVDPAAPRENYSLLIMGDSSGDGDGDGDGSGVDGDGSGGTSPSRQGAGTEPSAPRTWLRDGGGYESFSGKLPSVLGFSRPKPFIGERTESGGQGMAHTPWWRGQGCCRAKG